MKAIVTTYKGPTNTRGARIWASDEDGNRVSIPYPHELRSEDGHIKAAQRLCDKMGWTGKRACGAVKRGYVHVFVEDDLCEHGCSKSVDDTPCEECH